MSFENSSQSPNKGTLRELDEELHALRKENFNLKLRIFFFEEKELKNENCSNYDDIHKQFIDLKVTKKITSLFFNFITTMILFFE